MYSNSVAQKLVETLIKAYCRHRNQIYDPFTQLKKGIKTETNANENCK